MAGFLRFSGYLTLLLTVFLLAPLATAQYIPETSLEPGFLPDPYVFESSMYSGYGPISNPDANPDCVGNIDFDPSLLVTMGGDFSYLRIAVSSTIDTTLYMYRIETAASGDVNLSDYRCADDVEGFDPVLEGSWEAGLYAIYVGNFADPNSSSAQTDFSLTISEFAEDSSAFFDAVNADPPKPQPISSQLRITEVPDGGSATLYPGFTPDPYVMSFVAGGSEQASQYGAECLGNVNSKPDHVIYLGAFSYLKIEVASQADTTLVVYGEPYDQWFCNDDSNGFNPLLEGEWLEGFYYVYVGSFNGKPSYDLNITEVP
jgi:hypothetical protein